MLTSLAKGYYLGIDGGGTKSHAVITDESGFVLGEGKSGGSNPHNVSFEVALGHLREAVGVARKDVIAKRGVREEELRFEAACLGLAGIDTDMDRVNVSREIMKLEVGERTFGAREMLLVNDGLVTLKAGTDVNWGISLIAGTGANCYGLSPSGREAIAGDWGFVLGDQGSSYAMGREILRQVLKEYDGRRHQTKLTQAVLEFYRFKEVPELVDWVYRNQVIPVQEIAALARIFDDTSLGDCLEVSRIINLGVSELVEAYAAVSRRMAFDEDEVDVPVVLGGGLFAMKGLFAERVKRSILDMSPNVEVIIPKRSPAEGAAKIARSLRGELALSPETGLRFVVG